VHLEPGRRRSDHHDARWTGVSLRDVQADTGVQPRAAYLLGRSADGFHEIVDLALVEDDPRIMLTYQWDGIALLPQPRLPAAHLHPRIATA